MKKGSITIYMSMILAVLLSLFLMVIEGARSRAISLRADCAFDLAVYSVFAEYNRQLYKEYGLFFIDTSYGEITASSERVNRHLTYYMKENLDKDTGGRRLFNYTKCFPEQTEITGCRYATDERGAVFEQQAIEYMKYKYGISYMERMKKELEQAQEHHIFNRDFSAEREENHREIEEAEREGVETGELDENGDPIRKPVDVDNPADAMNQTRAKGILVLVTDSEDEISVQSVDIKDTVSYENPKTKGYGEIERAEVSFAERLWFDAFVLDKCGTYISPKKNGQLQYQAEYVLAGKECDMDNLKAVVQRLLVFREVSNCIYLFSDAAKVGEAAALATSICSAAGAMALIEPVKCTLLFAWGYAEAIYDVKQLLAGGSVPVIKTAETWHYSLSGMLGAEAEKVSKETVVTVKEGLSYEEYLRLFLATEEREKKVYRMMDIAQMDVRKNSGFKEFHLSNCVDLLVMEAVVGSKYGYYKELKRQYSYK